MSVPRLVKWFNVARFVFCLTLSIIVSSNCPSAFAATKKKPVEKMQTVDDFRKTPKDTINHYISTCLGGATPEDYDAGMVTFINNRRNSAPEELKQQEEWAASQENGKNYLAQVKDKKENGTELENVINLLSGSGDIPFHKIIYKGMKYRIMEVRNKTVKGPLDEMSNHTKEAYVEITYASPDFSPRDQGQKVKKAVVRVKIQARKTNIGIQYLVQGYDVTKYSREYF